MGNRVAMKMPCNNFYNACCIYHSIYIMRLNIRYISNKVCMYVPKLYFLGSYAMVPICTPNYRKIQGRDFC